MSTVTVEIKGKEDVSTHAKKAGGSLRDLVQEQNNMVKGFATAAVAGAAVTAVIRQIAQAVDQCVIEFAANERATLAFNAAIKGSGTISAGAGNGLAQFAEEIAIMTGQTGESVQSMETLLVTSGRTESEVRKLISAAVDMSAATGTDLNTAVEQLNATFSGTEGRLGKLIPELQGLTKEQLLAGDAVDIIAEKYDGLGDALQDSADVSIKNYKNAMSDLKAELGGLISFGLSPLREWLTTIVRQWGEAAGAARNYTNAMIKAKGGASLDSFTEAELVALNKAKQEFIEQRKGVLLQLKDGSDDFKTVTGQIEKAVKEQQAVADQLKNFSLDRAYARFIPTAAPVIPTTTGKTSSTVDPFQAFIDSLRKELGPKLVDSGIDDAIASYFEESVSTAFSEMMGVYPLVSSNSGISEYQSPLFESMLNEIKETFQWQGTTKDMMSAAGDSKDAGNGPLQVFIDAMGPVLSTVLSVVGSLGSIQALLDPIGTIIAGIMDILGPLIDTLLALLVGIFRILGQTLGKIVAPLFEALGPIIQGIAEVFVWLYNKVLKPFGNGLIAVFNVVYNGIMAVINGIIWAINLLLPKKKELDYVNYRELTAGALTDISVGQLSTAGAASSTSTTGSNASYSQARDVTVNVSVTTSALVGDDGIRQFSLMIWREIKSAGVLGAA